jgi:hypothetical protein
MHFRNNYNFLVFHVILYFSSAGISTQTMSSSAFFNCHFTSTLICVGKISLILWKCELSRRLYLGVDLQHWQRGRVFVGGAGCNWTGHTAFDTRVGLGQLEGHLHAHDDAVYDSFDAID